MAYIDVNLILPDCKKGSIKINPNCSNGHIIEAIVKDLELPTTNKYRFAHVMSSGTYMNNIKILPFDTLILLEYPIVKISDEVKATLIKLN